jgi:hypothetical protein
MSTALSIIEKAASSNLSIEVMERLFSLYEKENEIQQERESKQAEMEFNASMAKAQGSIQKIVKNRSGHNNKYTFADLSAIHEECKKIWTDEGFSIITSKQNSQIQNNITIITELRHSAGHKVEYRSDWPLDAAGAQGNVNKTPIQAQGSTVSYARRYTILMIFDISTGDDDDGVSQAKPKTYAEQRSSNNPALQPINQEQVNYIVKQLQLKNKTMETLLQYMQVSNINDIRQGQLKIVNNFINGK